MAEGDWRLRAIVPGRDPESGRGSYRNGLVELRVGRLDIDDVQIRTEAGFPIDVSADWGDSPPAKLPLVPARALITLAPLDSQLGGNPDEGSEGRYFIGPPGIGSDFMPDGFYTAAAVAESRQRAGAGRGAIRTTSLKMIYKTGGGSVRGTVEHGANAIVVLMADAIPRASRFSAQCNADGGFLMRDRSPGEYSAVALQGPGTITSAEILRLLAASGKRIEIDAGAAAQVDLRLTQR